MNREDIATIVIGTVLLLVAVALFAVAVKAP